MSVLSVGALVLSVIAVSISWWSLRIAHRADERDAARRHDEQTPTITAEWSNDRFAGDERLTLTLAAAPEGGFERASAHVPTAAFADDDGTPFGDHTDRPDLWPTGYHWTLPKIIDAPPNQPLPLVVTVANDDRVSWEVFVQTVTPPGVPQVH